MAVGVGFYGNSETNDGVYQLTYSLYNANHTLGGVESLVGGAAESFKTSSVYLTDQVENLNVIFGLIGWTNQ